ncbi:DUF4268 domain-containing protein [Bradyrhizobium sp. RDT46]|uniref:DUF4268 domain-containing protein n=1 Tax=Bradyrhizobium sp. RDT46 TaxID=3341829 RepID=UPI0035C6BAFC
MISQPLSRLEQIDLKDVWSHEASSFTPWLALEQNIALLGDTLGLELEVEAQEKAVGPFRADILCKDLQTNTWVLIENQLERTDHTHLGQVLTYASGLGAVTIVWIAARFTEEHRATLDWLNKITDRSFRFFGIEVELWRIGGSSPAPKFNIISKPNDWSQSVARAARALDETDLSDTRIMQRDYWAGLNTALTAENGPVSGNKKPQPQSWMSYPIGRFGFYLTAAVAKSKRQIRAELYLHGERAKRFYYLLETQRADIERALGYALSWEELPDGQDSRIACYRDDVDPADATAWPSQHTWLSTKLNELHRVFASRVKVLQVDEPAAGYQPDEAA